MAILTVITDATRIADRVTIVAATQRRLGRSACLAIAETGRESVDASGGGQRVTEATIQVAIERNRFTNIVWLNIEAKRRTDIQAVERRVVRLRSGRRCEGKGSKAGRKGEKGIKAVLRRIMGAPCVRMTGLMTNKAAFVCIRRNKSARLLQTGHTVNQLWIAST
ncbi:hypothetical protein [Sphingomonas sp. 32-62-10]|uniref:hypothetical protein n=1 Tax=Sphingomonas sp. 32-62-10 TaxID=1970436 RepID=UPI0035A94C97